MVRCRSSSSLGGCGIGNFAFDILGGNVVL